MCMRRTCVLLSLIEDSGIPVRFCRFMLLYRCILGNVLCLLFFSADELISPKDIDPIQRYVPLQNQRNVSMRFSNQVKRYFIF